MTSPVILPSQRMEFRLVTDNAGLFDRLNNEYLPDHSGSCRLQLFHHVLRLQQRFQSGSALVYGLTPRPARPDNLGSLSADEQAAFQRKDDWHHYECVCLEVEWLRQRLAVLCPLVGLPSDFCVLAGVSIGDQEMQGLEFREDNANALWNHAHRLRNKRLKEIVEALRKALRGLELPERWEVIEYHHYPSFPINNRESLIDYLRETLDDIDSVGPTPTWMLKWLSRVLRNSRRLIKQFIATHGNRIEVLDAPQTVYEAEREIERLIEVLECELGPTLPPPNTMNPHPSPSTDQPLTVGDKSTVNQTIESDAEGTVPQWKRRRGKPRKHDPRESEIVAAWQSKKYRTLHDLVEGLGVSKYQGREPYRRVELIIDRHRKRSMRAEKAGGQNRMVNSKR